MIDTVTNDYWDAVRDHIEQDNLWGGPVVDNYGAVTRDYRERVDRFALCGRYSWTVTAPQTVAFVVEHAGARVVDPMAGSGWWANLLTESGIHVTASDLNPPDGTEANHWHREGQHVPVLQLDAVQAATVASADATLLLSWPPYDSQIGHEVLAAFGGRRVVYIGEGAGGCCGDDAMFDLLGRDWNEVAEHRPVQYYGIHDYVTIYDRRGNTR